MESHNAEGLSDRDKTDELYESEVEIKPKKKQRDGSYYNRRGLSLDSENT